MSIATPNAGLAVIDEKLSEPPHCSPTVTWLASTGTRVTLLASGSNALIASMPASMVCLVPPESCITKVLSVVPAVSFSAWNRVLIWLRSHPSPTTSTAAMFGWRM